MVDRGFGAARDAVRCLALLQGCESRAALEVVLRAAHPSQGREALFWSRMDASQGGVAGGSGSGSGASLLPVLPRASAAVAAPSAPWVPGLLSRADGTDGCVPCVALSGANALLLGEGAALGGGDAAPPAAPVAAAASAAAKAYLDARSVAWRRLSLDPSGAALSEAPDADAAVDRILEAQTADLVATFPKETVVLILQVRGVAWRRLPGGLLLVCCCSLLPHPRVRPH